MNTILNQLIEMEKAGELECCFFDDIPIAVYHDSRCPGVSSSKLKQVYSRTEPKGDSTAFALGRAFHAMVLEPHIFDQDFAVGSPSNGKTYISFTDWEMLQRMVEVLKKHSLAMSMLNNSAKERTFFSRDKDTGVLKKCRTDFFTGSLIGDLKTCESASKDDFTYSSKKYGYGFSAAYYLDIVSEVTGTYLDNFQWVAIEKSMSPRIGLYHPTQDSISRKMIEVKMALETYKINQTMSDKHFIGASEESIEVWV